MGLFGTRKTKRRIKDDGSVIVLDRVSKSYSTGAPALNGVNLRVKKGEFVFIVGDSGSGKSTLIKLLLRELTPTSGTILVNGQSVADLKPRQIPRYRRNLGIVFQDFRLLKDRNVYENVAFAQRIIQVPTKEIKRNVPAILATVGLAGKYKAKPKQLSGGEQQRVALAGADQQAAHPACRRTYRKPGSQELLGNHEASGENQRRGNHNTGSNPQP